MISGKDRAKGIMSEEENAVVVKRFIDEMWNQRQLDVADQLFAPNCTTHQLRGGEDRVGAPRPPESVKEEAAGWLAGFSDLRFEIEEMLSTGDRVVSRLIMRGTHNGTWMGIA